MAWLSAKLADLRSLGRRRAASDAEFWEPFLAELARCKDAEACLLVASSRAFPALRASLSTWFADYAHWRDMARAESLCQSYLGSGAPDGLSCDMRLFIQQERSMTGADAPGGPSSVIFVGCGLARDPTTICNRRPSHRRGRPGQSAASAAARAIETFRRLNLGHAEARVGDGCRFDYGPFDLVHVANFVSQKAKVLAQVATTARRGTRVVVRVPTFLEQVLCEAIDPANCGGLELQSQQHSNYCCMISFLLIVK